MSTSDAYYLCTAGHRDAYSWFVQLDSRYPLRRSDFRLYFRDYFHCRRRETNAQLFRPRPVGGVLGTKTLACTGCVPLHIWVDSISPIVLYISVGITLAENFSRKSTVLLCPSGTGAKFDKAGEWGVPVVNMSWLEEMSATGAEPSVFKHLVRGVDDDDNVIADMEEPEVKKLDKGKGKAKDTMTDITNSKRRRFVLLFFDRLTLH